MVVFVAMRFCGRIIMRGVRRVRIVTRSRQMRSSKWLMRIMIEER